MTWDLVGYGNVLGHAMDLGDQLVTIVTILIEENL